MFSNKNLVGTFQEITRQAIEQVCGNTDTTDSPTSGTDGSSDGTNDTDTTDSPECTFATFSLLSNTDCVDAVSDPDNIDGATACSTICRSLFQAVVNACGNSVSPQLSVV